MQKFPLSFLICFGTLMVLSGCKNGSNDQTNGINKESTKALKKGLFKANLNLQGHQSPFLFEVLDAQHLELINGSERIKLDTVIYRNDSAIIPMHIFDSEIRAQLGDTLSGIWRKNYYDDYQNDFIAVPYLTIKTGSIIPRNIDGKWAVSFSSAEGEMAIGEFKQKKDKPEISGTFLTTTGDYRFLTGQFEAPDSFYLSTFDGEHAFLFTGKIAGDSIVGDFYSGPKWHEIWNAHRNDTIQLKPADKLTYLKDGYNELSFSALDLDSNQIKSTDQKLIGKAMLIQIMGTWCPNCMDETAYLAKWASQEKPKNLEIVSLAFERKDDFSYAKERLSILKKHYSIPYTLCFAGPSSKEAAAERLPALNAVIAYPTLIFINTKHEVVKIHTGFSGPGTGDYFERWKLEFDRNIAEITE